MKAKLLRRLGFELLIDSDGAACWVLPSMTLSASTGEALSLPQLAAVLDRGLALADKPAIKARKKIDVILANEAAKESAPEK